MATQDKRSTSAREDERNNLPDGEHAGNHGSFSDEAPGLVPPSHLNQGDTGAASDRPDAGGTLNFDDDEIYGGRGNNVRRGGTAAAVGADSAPLGPPAEIHSDRNRPDDGPTSGDTSRQGGSS